MAHSILALMAVRTSLLRQRIASLARRPVIVSLTSVYLGELLALVVYRNSTLISSSFLTGHADTAFLTIAAGLLDSFTAVPENMALHAALFFIAADLVLAVIYIRKIRTVAGAVKPIGLGIGATALFVLSLGCLSCGAVLGLSFSALLGASLLPWTLAWGGVLFLWGAVLLLCSLMLVLAKKVTDPFVC